MYRKNCVIYCNCNSQHGRYKTFIYRHKTFPQLCRFCPQALLLLQKFGDRWSTSLEQFASGTASARHRTGRISTATENAFVCERHRRLVTIVFGRPINILLLLLLLLLLSRETSNTHVCPLVTNICLVCQADWFLPYPPTC